MTNHLKIVQSTEFESLRNKVASSGEPPYDGGMDTRLTALETRLDTVLPTLATKADLQKVEGDVIKWVAGIGIASVASIISVIGFLASRIDIPKQSQQAPIVINVPPQIQAPQAPQNK